MELSEWHMWWKRRGGSTIRRILMEEWDPIGVRGVPQAADEYDSYVAKVAAMLREGATAADVAAYLTYVSTELMCLGDHPRRDRAVADHLVRWYAKEMQASAPE